MMKVELLDKEEEHLKWVQRVDSKLDSISTRLGRLEFLLARLLTETDHNAAMNKLKEIDDEQATYLL